MGWLGDAGGFAGIAALLVAAATWYSHRTSAKASARSGDLQEQAVKLQEAAQETTDAEVLTKGALALAQAVQTRLAQVEASLNQALERAAAAETRATDADQRATALGQRVSDLEAEREELLELLEVMGAPRTIAQARRRQRRKDAGGG